MELFLLAGTQRRFNAVGAFAGFDYAGVRAAARLARRRITPEDFARFQLLEAEAIRIAAEKAKSHGNPH